MIRVGIVGATGYAGGELVRILMGHKEVEIKWYGSRSYIDKEYAAVYQNMFQIVDDICKDDNLKEMAKLVDVIFTATPQGFLAGLLDEEILSQVSGYQRGKGRKNRKAQRGGFPEQSDPKPAENAAVGNFRHLRKKGDRGQDRADHHDTKIMQNA